MNLFIFIPLTILGYMTIMFLLALLLKDNSIADIAWGLGFIISSLIAFFYEPLHSIRHIIVIVLILLWRLRLAIHVLSCNKENLRISGIKNGERIGGKIGLYEVLFNYFLAGI